VEKNDDPLRHHSPNFTLNNEIPTPTIKHQRPSYLGVEANAVSKITVTDFSRLSRGKRIAGANIPQHRLLSRLEWDRLRRGKISRFTYWTTTGPFPDHNSDNHSGSLVPHAFSVVVRKEDAP
jgi:hypothetical protein